MTRQQPYKKSKTMIKEFLSAVGLLTTISACSIARSVPDGRVVSGQAINNKGEVLIMNIADGQEQGEPVAKGSGQAMVSAIKDVLLNHNVPVTTSQAIDLIPAFDEAEKVGSEYTLRCVITLWEDNATFWSGNGDKLRISLELYSSKQRKLVAKTGYYRVGTGFTFVSGTPQRFMGEAAEGALNRIYGWDPSK